MAFRIVRSDIAKMNTDTVVSPRLIASEPGEERLRAEYRTGLTEAYAQGHRSASLPLVFDGDTGCTKEESLRIAADEINAFLPEHDMDIFLVVPDDREDSPGRALCPGLEEYIDRNYVEPVPKSERIEESKPAGRPAADEMPDGFVGSIRKNSLFKVFDNKRAAKAKPEPERPRERRAEKQTEVPQAFEAAQCFSVSEAEEADYCDFEGEHESKLEERMRHLSDTFSQYLMYLIKEKGLENAEVYRRAIVDKKVFSKIKNNPDYHPQKLTALCLCVGAGLNLDESKDLLARAGYALSPCDKTDIIFSYFIENEIYDMLELDIQLEEHGLPCIIQ